MGQSTSRPSRVEPQQAVQLPAYCIKDAQLTPEITALARSSWKKLLEGTQAHRRIATAAALTGGSMTVTSPSATEAGAGTKVGGSVAYGSSTPGAPVAHAHAGEPSAAADVAPNSPGDGMASAGGVPAAEASAGGAGGAPAYTNIEQLSPLVLFYDTFYTRLFEVAPSVRPLFKGSLKVQGRALLKMVDTAVHLLDKPESLLPALDALARRHIAYGTQVPHYSVVGEVLLHTLSTCLGEEEWTPAVQHAWLVIYSVMMSVMIPAHVAEEQRQQRAATQKGCFSPSGGSPVLSPAKGSGRSTPPMGSMDTLPTSPVKGNSQGGSFGSSQGGKVGSSAAGSGVCPATGSWGVDGMCPATGVAGSAMRGHDGAPADAGAGLGSGISSSSSNASVPPSPATTRGQSRLPPVPEIAESPISRSATASNRALPAGGDAAGGGAGSAFGPPAS